MADPTISYQSAPAYEETAPLLIFDTCGERGSVALFHATGAVEEIALPERTASAGLLGIVREMLRAAELELGALAAVGVVNGPGSFTGVRVGLAVAKGLCEGAGLPMATVSRLAVLAELGQVGGEGYAVLRAGRDQLYVRDGASGREQLLALAAFQAQARGASTVFAEPELGPALEEAVPSRLVSISATSAVHLVRKCLRQGGTPLAAADANYVRDEGTIYRRAGMPVMLADSEQTHAGDSR